MCDFTHLWCSIPHKSKPTVTIQDAGLHGNVDFLVQEKCTNQENEQVVSNVAQTDNVDLPVNKKKSYFEPDDGYVWEKER